MTGYGLGVFILACIVAVAEFTAASSDAKKIDDLEKQVQILSNLVQAQSSVMARFSCQAHGSNHASACITKIADQAKNISQLQKEVRVLDTLTKTQKSQIQQLQLSVKGTWPSGRYCILAHGSCPPGFTRSSGYMKAISLYAADDNYINEAKFGDSTIKCHGGCGQYGHWIGELFITTCCK